MQYIFILNIEGLFLCVILNKYLNYRVRCWSAHINISYYNLEEKENFSQIRKSQSVQLHFTVNSGTSQPGFLSAPCNCVLENLRDQHPWTSKSWQFGRWKVDETRFASFNKVCMLSSSLKPTKSKWAKNTKTACR